MNAETAPDSASVTASNGTAPSAGSTSTAANPAR
jgi:hypothetical protein